MHTQACVWGGGVTLCGGICCGLGLQAWGEAEGQGSFKGGFGTRPWWLALLACGGAYWPLALEPSAMTSRHPYFCGHPHCCRHPPALVGI